MRTGLRSSIAFTLALALPVTAMAQVPPPPTAAAPEPEPEPEVFPPPEDAALPDDQKPEKAKELYIEAEGLVANGDYNAATPLYERAYYLVPGKHGFAYKVGTSAFAMSPRDCNKADDYLKHYVKYADPNKHPDWMDEAKRILGEIAVSGCKVEEEAPAAAGTTQEEPEETGPVAGEGPTFVSAEEERRQAAEAEAAERDANSRSGMFKGGIAMAVVGAAALGGGAVTLIMANNRANQLADLSSSSLDNSSTGFPAGDWDCRVPGDACPSDLDKQRRGLNGASYGLLIGGGVLTAVGVTLIALDVTKKKKNASASVTPVLSPGFTGASASVKF